MRLNFAVLLGLGCLACQDPRALGVELCGNGIDDDLDGRLDCGDPSCDDAPECELARPSREGSFAPLDPESKLGRVLQGDCSDDPAELRTGAQRPDCQLFPDDCGYGRRCLPLSVQGRYLRSRCVRQGCARPYEACDSAGSNDRCPRHTLCLAAQGVCNSPSCCVPLCALAQRDSDTCGDCRPLSGLFEFAKKDRRLHKDGICLDPRP